MVHKFITAKFGNGFKDDGSLGCGYKSNYQSARNKKEAIKQFCVMITFTSI